MGLFSKIKNVLFEEEEIEIPVFTKEEPEKEEIKPIKKVVEPKKVEQVRENVAPIKEEPKISKPEVQEDNERETFKTEPTFQFPIFDEKEFAEPKKNLAKKKTTEKNNAKKVDFGRFDTRKTEVVEEKKHFKPSPIISPVYGIRDKNYSVQDFTPKKEEPKRVIDVDTIRKKAYGTLEDEIEQTLDKPAKEFYEDKPTKSINELLIDSVDEEIPIDVEDEIDFNLEDEMEDIDEVNETPTLDVLDQVSQDKQKKDLDDTLESDLFNLIDSMYTNGEDEN